jgi:hypothetical protein
MSAAASCASLRVAAVWLRAPSRRSHFFRQTNETILLRAQDREGTQGGFIFSTNKRNILLRPRDREGRRRYYFFRQTNRTILCPSNGGGTPPPQFLQTIPLRVGGGTPPPPFLQNECVARRRGSGPPPNFQRFEWELWRGGGGGGIPKNNRQRISVFRQSLTPRSPSCPPAYASGGGCCDSNFNGHDFAEGAPDGSRC